MSSTLLDIPDTKPLDVLSSSADLDFNFSSVDSILLESEISHNPPEKMNSQKAIANSDPTNTQALIQDTPQVVPHISIPKIKAKRKRDSTQLRKAPQAPKRFKSSYICFFMSKQQEIKDVLGNGVTVTDVSKRSAKMWRTLPANERAYWDDIASKDKQRYMQEKACYTGPWQVPWKRAKKDPSAPKRPMSAFLYFSQERRRIIKEKNPKLRNTDISRILGEMWRNASGEERNPHIEHEACERKKYKVSIAKWRVEHQAKEEAQRKAQEERAAKEAALVNTGYGAVVEGVDPLVYPHQQGTYFDPNTGFAMDPRYFNNNSQAGHFNYMGGQMPIQQLSQVCQNPAPPTYSTPQYPHHVQMQVPVHGNEQLPAMSPNDYNHQSVMSDLSQNVHYTQHLNSVQQPLNGNYQSLSPVLDVPASYDPNSYSQGYYHQPIYDPDCQGGVK